LPGLTRSHFEKRRSTGVVTAEYNAKGKQPHAEWLLEATKGPNYGKDADFYSFGKMRPGQGTRTDLQDFYKLVKAGKTDLELAEFNFATFSSTLRAIDRIRFAVRPVSEGPREIILLCGPKGVGKTRWAYDNYPDLYKKPTGEWWNGYEGQKVVLFDDYYGYFKYHDLLTILDRYPINLPIKGGFVWAQYDTVIITSNKHPKDWYKLNWGWPLRRRLNKIFEVKVIDGETSYAQEDYPADEEAWRASEETYDIT